MNQNRLLAAVALIGLSALGLQAVAADDGWVSLFDGHSLDGWQQINGLAKYEAKDGAIVGSTAPNSPNSFLCTKKLYGDFELEFDVRCDAKLNSGCQIRSESRKDHDNGRVHGYQVEIAVGGYSGAIYDEARRGIFLNERKEPTPEQRALLKKDQWNHYRILCQGDRIQAWVNGVQVTDLRDKKTACGFIGLQVHGVGPLTDTLKVEWRCLRLRELPAK